MADELILGEYVNPRGADPLFRLGRADRRQHVYLVGKTGAGKSTLMHSMALQDIEAGDGVALVDPHGDLAEELLDRIPAERTQEIVYFNPADREHPAGFNLLQAKSRDEHHLVVSGVVAAFKHLWADSWGPRLEYILANAVAALLEHGDSTILGVLRMLSDDAYRERVVSRVRDPVVRRFWEAEFGVWGDRLRAEAIAPVQNKLGRLLGSPLLRNILGQVSSTIEVDRIMAERRILIANLSKGKLGEDKANLLGALLVSAFQLAAMRRAGLSEDERPDFFLYVDEFQSFGTEAFAAILSEARKYRLSLTLAHQYLDQLPPLLQQAVFGNVGTLVSFTVGARDAEVLAPELPIPAWNLVDLDKHNVWVRLLRDGVAREAFRGRTLPPPATAGGRREILVRRSRQHHARPRAVVEERVGRWWDR